MYIPEIRNYDYREAAEINSAMGRVYGHMSLAVITSMIIS